MNNLTLRIITALLILPVVLAILFWAPVDGFALAAVLTAAIAGWEFGNITLSASPPPMRFFLAGVSAMVAASLAFRNAVPDAPTIVLITVAPLFMTTFMFSIKTEKKIAAADSAFATLGAIYTGALFGAMAMMVREATHDLGRYWFFALLATTTFNDTFAYAFGRRFGKRKMAPAISPAKTWAGAVGGALGAVIAMVACQFIFLPSLPLWKAPLIGLAVGVAAQTGDLAESFIKRAFQVKDSGRIIPGHGGILDRCDALMVGAPGMLFFALTH